MKQKVKKLPFILILTFFAAFLLRCLLINWTLDFGNNGDLVRYEDWARIAHSYGFADTYKADHSTTVVNNEPPGTLYTLSATYESYITIGKIIAKLTHTKAGSLTWVNTYLQHIVMKSLPLLTDLLIGFFIYLLVKKEAGGKNAILACLVYLFNPVIWYNSAIWGQMDSVNNLFFIISLFFAFRRNIIFSLMFFAFSVYIKFSLLPLLPFYLTFLYFLSEKRISRLILGVSVSLFMIIFATYPISSNPIQWLIQNLPPLSGGELQNITNAAFNFWWALTCFPSVCNGNNIPIVNQLFLGISLNIWGYLFFGFFTIPILLFQFKKPKYFIQKKNLFLIFAIVALSIFLFLPKMHDRYMYPFFPLFSIFLGLSGWKKKSIIVFMLLTLFQIINLIYSWYPTYFPIFVIYQILYNNVFRWSISLLTVTTFLWLYGMSHYEFIHLKSSNK